MDHRTPTEERWGGWYVTGTAGSQKHLGNLVLPDRRAQALPPWSASQALATLAGRFDTSAYLSGHSDIVALLVFEHQMRMTNLLTRIGWDARVALHAGRQDAAAIIAGAAAEVVDYLLFVDETPLPDKITGTSGFAQKFSAEGPVDHKGRSLRQLDLSTRLLKYPCSYMIYSDVFDALPIQARDATFRRLWDVLALRETGPKYAKLSRADRSAVLEILRDTKPNLPDYFQPIAR